MYLYLTNTASFFYMFLYLPLDCPKFPRKKLKHFSQSFDFTRIYIGKILLYQLERVTMIYFSLAEANFNKHITIIYHCPKPSSYQHQYIISAALYYN